MRPFPRLLVVLTVAALFSTVLGEETFYFSGVERLYKVDGTTVEQIEFPGKSNIIVYNQPFLGSKKVAVSEEWTSTLVSCESDEAQRSFYLLSNGKPIAVELPESTHFFTGKYAVSVPLPKPWTNFSYDPEPQPPFPGGSALIETATGKKVLDLDPLLGPLFTMDESEVRQTQSDFELRGFDGEWELTSARQVSGRWLLCFSLVMSRSVHRAGRRNVGLVIGDSPDDCRAFLLPISLEQSYPRGLDVALVAEAFHLKKYDFKEQEPKATAWSEPLMTAEEWEETYDYDLEILGVDEDSLYLSLFFASNPQDPDSRVSRLFRATEIGEVELLDEMRGVDLEWAALVGSELHAVVSDSDRVVYRRLSLDGELVEEFVLPTRQLFSVVFESERVLVLAIDGPDEFVVIDKKKAAVIVE